jgi:glyoxylate/hydroxypyruvate reductase A
VQGIETYSSEQMDSFLSEINVLVNLLPLTPETDGILNLEYFKKMKKPGFLIHAGRGEHLLNEDLIYAIDTGLIEHAWLDAFEEEPLPSSHPFWSRQQITVTPHIAGVSQPEETAVQILENYKRLISGMELTNRVDRKKGY